jgi:hypothetical protein
MTEPTWSDPAAPGQGGTPPAPQDPFAQRFGALDPGRPSPTAAPTTPPAPSAPMSPVAATPGVPPPPYQYGPAPMYGGYGVPGGPQPIFIQQPKNNGLALASMVVSIAGVVLLVCYGIGGAAGLVGAILGHVARRQIREREEGGDGMALAGIIVGWVTVGISLLILAIVIAIFYAAFTFSPPPPDGNGGFDDGFDSGFDAIGLLLGALG